MLIVDVFEKFLQIVWSVIQGDFLINTPLFKFRKTI
jgi:hypothetical protein